ncbi:maleylpyruvate isomerase family mycothiol-dependent enzyme [Streptomyces sp. NPDC002073]
MEKNLEFPDLLRLIDERSTAFRAVVAAAPGLDAQVPTCPGWTLFDLVKHLGGGDRFWAAIVGAGSADAPPAEAVAARAALEVPQEREALLAWLDASTQLLLGALRAAGPESGCWTWWPASQSPQTAGGTARHRVQETAVHTYDAQLAGGSPQPLPVELALDGVEEFLFTVCATPSAWPHKPTAFDFHAAEGRSWRLTVDGDGARITRIPAPTAATGEDSDAAGASVHGTASELVLYLYDRIQAESLHVDGDAGLLDLLRAWEPEEK